VRQRRRDQVFEMRIAKFRPRNFSGSSRVSLEMKTFFMAIGISTRLSRLLEMRSVSKASENNSSPAGISGRLRRP